MSATLSEEQFANIINRLMSAQDLATKVNELFIESQDNIDFDYCNAASLQISHEKLVIYLLELIMDDREGIIKRFIYFTDFGRNRDVITPDMDNEIALKDAEALYLYLNRKKETYQS